LASHDEEATNISGEGHDRKQSPRVTEPVEVPTKRRRRNEATACTSLTIDAALVQGHHTSPSLSPSLGHPLEDIGRVEDGALKSDKELDQVDTIFIQRLQSPAFFSGNSGHKHLVGQHERLKLDNPNKRDEVGENNSPCISHGNSNVLSSEAHVSGGSVTRHQRPLKKQPFYHRYSSDNEITCDPKGKSAKTPVDFIRRSLNAAYARPMEARLA